MKIDTVGGGGGIREEDTAGGGGGTKSTTSTKSTMGAEGPWELSWRATLLGIVVGILFGAANAYLGLRVGLTVSASIPAAVMSVAFFRALRPKRGATVLEHNMVQTIGSAGESLAAGVIFTVPALILLGQSPGVLKIFILGSIGGLLGVLFMIPLRRYLVEVEHERLPYPEGTACASVLEAGHEGGARGGLVFLGLGFGALYEFGMTGLRAIKSTATLTLSRYQGAEISADSSPALLGVGFVLGPRVAAIMFGGGALAWLVFIPAIKLFGGSGEAIFPATVPISELDAHGVWSNYIRYIGAGAVAFGGILSLLKSAPTIVASGWAAIKGLRGRAAGGQGAGGAPERTSFDLPGGYVLAGIAIVGILMLALPRSMVPGGVLPTVVALLFAFFFVAVSSRIVGLIGSSSNPISGMTIGALLATSLLFLKLGWTDAAGQGAALAVGAIVCIAAAIAGDMSQDLKTGYLVRATPWKQQVGEMVGVLTSAAAIGWVVLRLHAAYGLGGDMLPAPQARLMSMVVQGVLSGDLPWHLVLIGVAVAATVETLGVPSLPFAVGLYLPFSLTTPIMLGGAIRWAIEKRTVAGEKQLEAEGGCEAGPEERGVLVASGLIAGSAFVGMALGMLRSVVGGPGLDACLAEGGGRLGCGLGHPGDVLAALTAWIDLGSGWAGRGQDLVSAVALAAMGLGLGLIALRPGRVGAGDASVR